MADAFLKHFPSAESVRFFDAVALAQSQRRSIEVEARFQMLGPRLADGPTKPIPASVFYRMQDYLNTRQLQGTVTTTTDSTQGDLRRTEGSDGTTWMRKRRVALVQSVPLGVRLALSEESPVPPPQSFRPEYVRIKKRTSYDLFGTARLDMTRVVDSNKKVTYEVELECMNLAMLKTKFIECASIVWKWLTGSNTLYTLDDLRAVTKELELASPSVKPGEDPLMRFNRDVLVQARNLKRADIVYGGLVGNPETAYEVTAKADGVRKLMVFNPSGCWAVMPPYEYNRVLTYEPHMQPLVGSWLDGEMVPKERRNYASASPPDTPYWFLVFDTLRVEGRSVQEAPLRTRLTLAKTVADLFLAHKTLRVHAKEFYPVKRVQDLFTTMASLHRLESTLAYKIDGYMLTPASTPYNPRSHELPMEQRVLVAVPDIVKWKPPEELTIDFAVRPGRGGLELYSSQKGVRGGVLFRGTAEIQKDSVLLQGIEPDTVVEFGWNDDERVLEPRRVRFDKVVGNDIRIAEEVWSDIHNPLPITALTSENDDTTRLRFALEWEIHKMPAQVVVRPRGLVGLLGALRVSKKVVEVWDQKEPAVFLQTHPTAPQAGYYVIQDTRVLATPPPGVIVDTWTVVQPLMGLYEHKEAKHMRLSWCMPAPTGALFWPDPKCYTRDERGLDRLKILPPYRTVVDTEFEGTTYIACVPSTWRVEGQPTPAPSVPVTPEVLPRAPEPVPEAPEAPEVPEASEAPEERTLWLSVPAPAAPAFRANLPVGDVEDLQCSWYTEYPVVRLGTIGDGSCLFHGVLQGYNPDYQATPTKRPAYARRLRTALADFITLQDPETPGKSFYESAGGGTVASVVPLDTLQTLLRGSEYLGDETYALLGLCMGVNIYVVRATGTELHKHLSYIHPLRRQWTVVINGTPNHYETVGLRTPEGLQTAFVPEDPFLRALDTSAPGF